MAIQSAEIELGTGIKLRIHSRTSCQNFEGTLMLLKCVQKNKGSKC